MVFFGAIFRVGENQLWIVFSSLQSFWWVDQILGWPDWPCGSEDWLEPKLRIAKISRNSQPCSLKIATIPGNCEQLLQPIGRDQPQGDPGVSLVVSWDPRFQWKTTRKKALKPAATVSLTDGSNFFHTETTTKCKAVCAWEVPSMRVLLLTTF